MEAVANKVGDSIRAVNSSSNGVLIVGDGRVLFKYLVYIYADPDIEYETIFECWATNRWEAEDKAQDAFIGCKVLRSKLKGIQK